MHASISTMCTLLIPGGHARSLATSRRQHDQPRPAPPPVTRAAGPSTPPNATSFAAAARPAAPHDPCDAQPRAGMSTYVYVDPVRAPARATLLLIPSSPLTSRLAEPRRLWPVAAAGLRLAHGAQAGAAPRRGLHVHRGAQPAGAPQPCALLPTCSLTTSPLHNQQLRMMQGDSWDEPTLLPTQGAALDVRSRAPQPCFSSFRSHPSAQLLPPAAYPNTPATSFATKFVHVSTNKARLYPTRHATLAQCLTPSPPRRCAPRSPSCCGRPRDGGC